MSKQVKVYLLDILQAIDEIEGFTKDLAFEEFSENKMAIRAVTMNFAIIGEATKQIPNEIKKTSMDRFRGSKWLEFVTG